MARSLCSLARDAFAALPRELQEELLAEFSRDLGFDLTEMRDPARSYGILTDHPVLEQNDRFLAEDRRREREAVADE